MCFFIKKNKAEDTPEDKYRKKLHDDVWAKNRTLRVKAKLALASDIALSVYPEGADRETAKKELEDAKFVMLCSMGEYDDIRGQLINYINNNTFNTTVRYPKEDRIPKSHQIVRSACEDFYSGRL